MFFIILWLIVPHLRRTLTRYRWCKPTRTCPETAEKEKKTQNERNGPVNVIMMCLDLSPAPWSSLSRWGLVWRCPHRPQKSGADLNQTREALLKVFLSENAPPEDGGRLPLVTGCSHAVEQLSFRGHPWKTFLKRICQRETLVINKHSITKYNIADILQ